jgi:gamma-glutamylcyclotransferase (GGCT)/AIG2-like uncharacterized protein YtfP
MPFYFAYGSNMDVAAMATRCPGSRPVGPAKLMRHRFELMREGYATVVRDPGHAVHGLLWDLALRDVARLDRYEDVDKGLYAKLYSAVMAAQGPRLALVYCGSNTGPGAALPGYMEAVIAAGRTLALPAAYLAELEQHLPDRRAAALRRGG